MMSLTFGLFTQVSGSGPLGPLVLNISFRFSQTKNFLKSFNSVLKSSVLIFFAEKLEELLHCNTKSSFIFFFFFFVFGK